MDLLKLAVIIQKYLREDGQSNFHFLAFSFEVMVMEVQFFRQLMKPFHQSLIFGRHIDIVAEAMLKAFLVFIVGELLVFCFC